MRLFGSEEDWRFVSRLSAVSWLVFYGVFLVYAFLQRGSFLLVDSANLVVHEGGHLLFGWFGETLGIWGGTILQWSVPLLLAGYFYSQKQITGFTFCMFFFFENFLYTATYMSDARAVALPLVSAGSSDYIEHDWRNIFGSLGIVQYDTAIGGCVSILGWCGMVATVVWFCYQTHWGLRRRVTQ
ncbi:MAG TPA: hypothetical protein VFA68_13735 [Terriglobales bacterium]|nr:hypothetical protein [Terriglobales bacterium]